MKITQFYWNIDDNIVFDADRVVLLGMHCYTKQNLYLILSQSVCICVCMCVCVCVHSVHAYGFSIPLQAVHVQQGKLDVGVTLLCI